MALHAPVLAYLDAVARLGSIRKAADRLNVASSAINRQLLNLEKTLGTQLFERLPRGVRLTSAGEMLIKHVRNTLREFSAVRSDIDDLRGLRKGNITIVAVEGIAAEFLPRILSEFHNRYPGINFTVNVMNGEQLISTLGSNEADIGFMFNPPPSGSMSWGTSVKLKIGAVMKPNHPLAGRKSIMLSDCQPYPVILPDLTFPNRNWLDVAISRSGENFHAVVYSNSFLIMRALAKEGMGIAFQTTVGIENDLRVRGLVHVPLKDQVIMPSVLVALLRARHKLPVGAAIFLGEIRQIFANMGDNQCQPHRSVGGARGPPAGRKGLARRSRITRG